MLPRRNAVVAALLGVVVTRSGALDIIPREHWAHFGLVILVIAALAFCVARMAAVGVSNGASR
jgi:hypothetical protein